MRWCRRSEERFASKTSLCPGQASLASLALVVLLMAPGAAAQTGRVSGTVRDSVGRGISGVSVRLVTVHDELLADVRADDAGRYGVPVPSGDSVRVLVRQVGFTPHESRVLVPHGASLTYDVTLKPLAQELAGIVVRGETNRRAFAERAAAGIKHAYFVDSAELATKDRRSVLVLFDQLSDRGIRVGMSRSGAAGNQGVIKGPGACGATVYVDGWLTRNDEVTHTVRAREIAGVEIYSSPQFAPMPYRGRAISKCPVVLIWTGAGFDWEPRKW